MTFISTRMPLIKGLDFFYLESSLIDSSASTKLSEDLLRMKLAICFSISIYFHYSTNVFRISFFNITNQIKSNTITAMHTQITFSSVTKNVFCLYRHSTLF